MKLAVEFHIQARKELDEAYQWYENQETGLGEEFLTAIRDVLHQIQSNPARYAVLFREIRHARTKRFPYGVYYRVEPSRLVVVAIFHTSRNPKEWESRS